MALRLFSKRPVFQNLKNIKIKNQKRNYGNDDHHLTRLEVDIANRNTADFLPQAQGSWAELNNKRQAINNGTLGLGVALLLSSIFGTIGLGMWDLTLFAPPRNKINKDFPGAKFE